MPEDHLRLYKSLSAHKAKYLVIGGAAATTVFPTSASDYLVKPLEPAEIAPSVKKAPPS